MPINLTPFPLSSEPIQADASLQGRFISGEPQLEGTAQTCGGKWAFYSSS